MNNQKKSPHEAGNSPELRGNDSGKTKSKAKGIMNEKQTQCKKIVEYIRANGHITSLEAAKHLNITQPCARIVDLESRGFVFNKPRFKVGNCKNPVAHYSIAQSGIEL